MTGQAQAAFDTDLMEADVTAVIEACGGDPKTAIKVLLVEQLVQEQQIERLAAALSFGYVRGRDRCDAAPLRLQSSWNNLIMMPRAQARRLCRPRPPARANAEL